MTDTNPTIDEQMGCVANPAPKVTDPDAWKKMCPVELMAGNKQLAEWANHWEQRALKAEQRLKRIDAVQVPDYPTVWAGGGAGPHVDKKDYDTLLDLLKRERADKERLYQLNVDCEALIIRQREERKKQEQRAEAAESKLSAIEKLGREPSEVMLSVPPHFKYVRAFTAMFNKMMEELRND